MKNLKRFEEFKEAQMINEEGKIANLATAALMGLSSMFGVAQAQELPKNVKEVITKTTTDPVKAHHMELTGWQLTATTVDTLWGALPGDSLIEQIEVTLADDSYFESGAYELTQSQKDTIQTMLDEVVSKRGLLTSVKISSSTDKTPVSSRLAQKLQSDKYSGDNAGLAQARADNLQKYLNGQGIDISLFAESDIQVEQGGENDASTRYVKVSCIYMCCSGEDLSPAPQDIETTYTFQKKVYDIDAKTTTTKHKGKDSSSIRKKKCGSKKNFKSRVDLKKCYFNQ